MYRMLPLIVAVLMSHAAATGVRTWTDISGKFTTRAEFVSLANGVVQLKKINGDVVSLPIEKLSKDDQSYVRTIPERLSAKARVEPVDAGDDRVTLGGAGAIPQQTLQRLKGATVFVRASTGLLETSGSGFLLAKRQDTAYLVTNAHVVALPSLTPLRVECVFHSGTKAEQSVPATIVILDEDNDLAILEVELDTLPEPVDIDTKVEVGETLPVFILGFPFGDALRTNQRHPAVTISRASISSIRRDAYDRIAVIQIDGDINPGNSGGPIVDAKGRLIGIAVAQVVGTQIGLAIPAENVFKMLSGRVVNARIETRTVKDGVADIVADVLLINPMQKIKSVSIHYVRDAAVKKRPKPNQSGQWPRLSNTQKVQLTVEGKRAFGEFKIRHRGSEDVVYAFQVTYVDGAGNLVHTEPETFRVGMTHPGLAQGDASRHPQGIVGRLPWGGRDGGTARRPVVKFSWRAPSVKIVRPPAASAVTGRVERDSHGRNFTAVTAKGTSLDLGKDLLQVFACPTGKVVYVIRRGDPVVTLVDPVTWKTVAEIPVPESPTSIWADTRLIGVACDKSRVVAIIDAQKRSLIASGALPDLSGYIPKTIIGRAPDGSIMSVWEQGGSPRAERALVHLGTDGKPRIMINEDSIYWATWLWDGTGIVAQGESAAEPSGRIDLKFPQGPWGILELGSNKLFGFPGFWTDTGPVFLSSDRKALVIPRTRVRPEGWKRSSGYRPDDSVDDRLVKGPRVPWTYLISPSFDRILREFPGNAIVELPKQRLFITVGTIGITYQKTQQVRYYQQVCYYVSSTDGGIVREITLEWPGTDQLQRSGTPYKFPFGPDSRPVFVPGHELLLMPNWGQTNYTAFRCGPVIIEDVQSGTSSVPVNDPPSTMAVDVPKEARKPEATSSLSRAPQDAGADPMDAIYGAIELQNLRVEGEPHHVGLPFRLCCELVNTSDHPLDIPLSVKKPRAGVIQCWITRVHDDAKEMNDSQTPEYRKGIGGWAILVPRQVAPGIAYSYKTLQSLPSIGRYRFYVEYRTNENDRLLQSKFVEFVVEALD